MLLQYCALGVTTSWDDGFPGARASRPHQAWHSLGHLPHLDQPGTAPWLSFGPADAVLADRVAACSIALKLSAGQRDSMRAGRPRSQGNHSPLEGESQKPSRQAKADAVGGGRRATSQKADVRPLGNSRLPVSPAPARHDGADHTGWNRSHNGCFRQGRPVDATGGAGYVTTAGRPPGNLGRSLLTPFPDPILSHSRHRAAVPVA